MDFREIKDTSRLENAYAKFGNVAYVEGWFQADCFKADTIRVAVKSGSIVEVTKKTGKPLWYLPVLQLEYRPLERLKMSACLDFSLIYCGKSFPKISPRTARDLELIARKRSQKDWRVELISAFESLTYQRQGRNKWVLVEVGKGYA
jgi:hypothetical protein